MCGRRGDANPIQSRGKMKAPFPVAALIGLLLAGTPALAQETASPGAAQNAQTEVIGPPQLRDFNLNGTVTRPAEEPPAATPPQRQPQQQRETTTATRPPAQTASQSSRSAGPETGQDSTAPLAVGPRPTLPQVTPAQTESAAEPRFADVVPPVPEPVGTMESGIASMLPWLVAALALGGAATWFFLRRRPRASFAGVGAVGLSEAPRPRPEPRPVPAQPRDTRPEPPPAPAALGPSGTVVSTRLRPWLDLEFAPERALVDDDKAAVKFQLSLFNSGTVPARDVLVEASLLNAGQMQDQQIQLFFDNPVAKGDRIAVIPPLQRVMVETAVFLPRNQVQPIEIEGRPLLVPLVALNALYSWSSGKGQTSTSYLVGRETEGEKLAPFRLDLGSRMYRNLGAREHELRVRR